MTNTPTTEGNAMFHPVTIEQARIVGSYQYMEAALIEANAAVRKAEQNLRTVQGAAAAVQRAVDYMRSEIMVTLP